jgi:hypothetical protein
MLDREGRRRSVTVAFRVSPEEDRRIEAFVAASGLTKQDYILARLLDREVTVVPSVRVKRALHDEVEAMYRELRRIATGEHVDADLLDVLSMLTEIYVGLGEEPGPSDTELEAESIADLERE